MNFLANLEFTEEAGLGDVEGDHVGSCEFGEAEALWQGQESEICFAGGGGSASKKGKASSQNFLKGNKCNPDTANRKGSKTGKVVNRRIVGIKQR